MVPLAIRPNPPQHLNFSSYYVLRRELGRFGDKESWRSAIFAHLNSRPEQLMLRLWQCVLANHEHRTPPSLEDFMDGPPTVPMSTWHCVTLVIGAACAAVLLASILIVFCCLQIRNCRIYPIALVHVQAEYLFI